VTQELVVLKPHQVKRATPAGLPALIADAGPKAARRFIEFFTANIRNPNTRRAYYRAVTDFFTWCEQHRLEDLGSIQPIHVAAYIEELMRRQSRPSVKQSLAAVRMLFDWLVIGQIVPMNPATSVRGPKHVVKKGKTPVLSAEEARQLFASIDTSHVVGLRDRALIGIMTYTFARVGAVLGMRLEDYYPQGKRWWVRLHEKGGKQHEMPAHHKLEAYLDEYIQQAGVAGDRKGFLFRSAVGRTKTLSERPLNQVDVYRMIRRRAKEAGILTPIGCHTFRATGITNYLENGGTLEKAQFMAAHESARTTGLYDRRGDEVTLDEVERIAI
jgi:site-specific recombinase XerD